MSNANTPFGLKPVQMLSGANWTAKVRLAYVSASYATALFVGDSVDIDSTNSEKEAAIKHMSVIKAAIAGPTLGVIVGIPQELIAIPQFTGAYAGGYPNLNQNYLPASTGGFVYVTFDQGDIIYEVQGDGYAAPSAGWIGWNANLKQTAAGSTVTGLSGLNMDTGTTTAPAVTNTLGWKIIGAVDRPDNDMTSVNAKWLVINNNVRLASQIAGIGS
jgi:hypothetical protein